MTENAGQLSTEQRELVAVGASVGAGCQPCVMAAKVQENAARMHLREAERLVGSSDEGVDPALGCGDDCCMAAMAGMAQ